MTRTIRKFLAAALNHPAILIAGLLCYALLLNREGTWVPSGNENVYLLYLEKAWNPQLLATDWTFQETTAGHPIFNVLFGWPSQFMSLEAIGWIGRLACWTATFIALFRVGSHFRMSPGVVAAGILLWLVQRQSFVATEWMIGTFEAKCVAYPLLLFALDGILKGKTVAPAILTGLAFSVHSAVGFWGGAALGMSFAMERRWTQTLAFAAWGGLASLPGVITGFTFALGKGAISPAEAEYLTLVSMPFHLDPMVFDRGAMCALLLMLLFNCLHARLNRQHRAIATLARFACFCGLFFIVGIVCRLLNAYSIVKLFPFRVFAVLIILLFFWHVGAAIVDYLRQRERPRPPQDRRGAAVLGVLAAVILLGLPSPITRFTSLASQRASQWREPDDDFRIAARWISQNTAPTVIVIAPPWRKDAFYFLRRPMVANWHAPRLNAFGPWRERIESLTGSLYGLDPRENLGGELDALARHHYSTLSPEALSAICSRYGGDVLLTTGTYAYPVLFNCGTYRVYELPSAQGL